MGRRIDAWTAAWTVDEVDAVVALLALETAPDDPAWGRAVEALGVPTPWAAVEVLRAVRDVFDLAGHVVAEDLAEAWLDRLPRHRKRRVHLACAAAMARTRRPVDIVRRAAHLVAAGRRAEGARALRALTALRARPTAWDDAMGRLDLAFDAVPAGGHAEAAEAAEWATRAWDAAGDADRAARARRRAVAWWTRLRRQDRADALRTTPSD